MGPLIIFGLLVFHISTEIEFQMSLLWRGGLRRQQPEQDRTKNEDNDNYPHPINPGKHPILNPKLDNFKSRNS